MGEEKDDTSKELVLPVTKLPPGQSSTVIDMGIQKRPGKAPKPTKPVVKDQVSSTISFCTWRIWAMMLLS